MWQKKIESFTSINKTNGLSIPSIFFYQKIDIHSQEKRNKKGLNDYRVQIGKKQLLRMMQLKLS